MIRNTLRTSLLALCMAVSCASCGHATTGKAEAASSSDAPTSPETAKSAEGDTVADDILSLTVYTPADSARVVSLLRDDTGENDVLHYARALCGLPYVASTLEVADPERLVVNLRQLDCTTLVESVMALTLTKRQGSDRFSDYCRNLMRLRYFGGRMDGYLSRLHYFTWWMHDNLSKGLISEVSDKEHFTAVVNVENCYMSQHPDKYAMLKAHPEWTDSIRRLEEKHNGPDGRYLPAASTSLSRKELACINDGDIIAIVTRKAGLDYSHLGFAVWGADSRLHLLNASSIHHKVIEEPKTLRKYLAEHPTSIGIRVFRIL